MNPVRLPTEIVTIGPWLRSARIASGKTQYHLIARGVGSQSFISAIENGKYVPLVQTIIKYLAALDLELVAVPKPKGNDERTESTPALDGVAAVSRQDRISTV